MRTQATNGVVIGWATAWPYVQPNREIVAYLLAHGARHNIFSAVAMGETAVLLIERGAIAALRSPAGETLSEIAQKAGHRDIAVILGEAAGGTKPES